MRLPESYLSVLFILSAAFSFAASRQRRKEAAKPCAAWRRSAETAVKAFRRRFARVVTEVRRCGENDRVNDYFVGLLVFAAPAWVFAALLFLLSEGLVSGENSFVARCGLLDAPIF